MAMFRLTSSKVVPNAVRAISSREAFSGSIKNAINGCDQNSNIIPIAISHHHQFSTDAKKQIDGKLVKIIKSEIKLKQMFVQRGNMPPTPDESPFTFQDNPWDEHVTLSRDFNGEKIDIDVTLPCGFHVRDDISSSDEDEDEDEEKDETSPIFFKFFLTVKVSKKNGKILKLDIFVFANGEMMVSAYTVLKEVESETSQPKRRPHILYENCTYRKEESDLENALSEYLKIRGINRINHVFMYDYMIKKCQRSPVAMLKELKKFIAQ